MQETSFDALVALIRALERNNHEVGVTVRQILDSVTDVKSTLELFIKTIPAIHSTSSSTNESNILSKLNQISNDVQALQLIMMDGSDSKFLYDKLVDDVAPKTAKSSGNTVSQRSKAPAKKKITITDLRTWLADDLDANCSSEITLQGGKITADDLKKVQNYLAKGKGISKETLESAASQVGSFRTVASPKDWCKKYVLKLLGLVRTSEMEMIRANYANSR